MNILVIGNGFDLAHGLPTKYNDFLQFCRKVEDIYANENTVKSEENFQSEMAAWETNDEVKQVLREVYEIRKKGRNGAGNGKPHKMHDCLEELYGHIENNFWIEYFAQSNMDGKGNWIDFENEISEVIQSLDEDFHASSGSGVRIENNIQKISNFWLNKKYYGLQKTYKDIRDDLLNDLNRLIRAFEIYLDGVVKRIRITKKSPDIAELEIDGILSFNYTQTFSGLYKESKKLGNMNPFDYIHGKADVGNNIKNNNMVLGIDEYLCEERKNKEVYFISFKKFYQRIYKKAEYEYKRWIHMIQDKYEQDMRCKKYSEMMYVYTQKKVMRDSESTEWKETTQSVGVTEESVNNLYFFGHSLDVTDKDILRDLILNDGVNTIVYYHKACETDKDDDGKSDLGEKIANLVRVIGQDELIKRTSGSTKTIEFVLQKDMVDNK